ncbi:hypothetical protein T4C_8807 [Trichinella pseudospiralis]|uniref:Uncharacterized protein n=1 Tax=Trichinella pseudospiralis TaxID=6337 RepID=A0A0V1IYD4_TRIPS|nr:hypothetical protein T4C_8807 [Trichinella pseudospiralis]
MDLEQFEKYNETIPAFPKIISELQQVYCHRS